MKFIELESERLRYRKFSEDDFAVVFGWLSDPESMRYRSDDPQNESQAREYIQYAIKNAEADECRDFVYAAVLKENHAMIGAAMLLDVPNNPGAGWTIHPNHWQQGYGTEMGRTMLRLGFDILHLRRITSACNALNTASYKIMERIGMRREAHFIKAKQGNSILNHEWCDVYQYALLREEWILRNK